METHFALVGENHSHRPTLGTLAPENLGVAKLGLFNSQHRVVVVARPTAPPVMAVGE